MAKSLTEEHKRNISLSLKGKIHKNIPRIQRAYRKNSRAEFQGEMACRY